MPHRAPRPSSSADRRRERPLFATHVSTSPPSVYTGTRRLADRGPSDSYFGRNFSYVDSGRIRDPSRERSNSGGSSRARNTSATYLPSLAAPPPTARQPQPRYALRPLLCLLTSYQFSNRGSRHRGHRHLDVDSMSYEVAYYPPPGRSLQAPAKSSFFSPLGTAGAWRTNW